MDQEEEGGREEGLLTSGQEERESTPTPVL